MILTVDSLISEELVAHTKYTLSGSEIYSYYIDKTIGNESLDRYFIDTNGQTKYLDTIQTINVGHNKDEQIYIQNLIEKLDDIIDLDFHEMSHNNGSMLDIYHISYSSHFSEENVIGQALQQKSSAGGWWDIFWKDTPLINGEQDLNSNFNTIIHEIGHTLGLSHPFGKPKDPSFDSSDTVMSYNKGVKGWNTWFSKNDIDALIKIWGRENDKGYITLDRKSKDYKYKKDEENYYIKTEIGYESITGLENLKFQDKQINIEEDIIKVFQLIQGIDHISGKIYRLYNAAFSRFPDVDGLSYWIEKNISNTDSYRNTANSFLISEEFIDLYGNLNNKDYITNLYTNILERSPDLEGYNYWTNQLEKGYEDRSEILMGFSEAKENKILFSAETNIF